MPRFMALIAPLPGLALCGSVTLVALALQSAEQHWIGKPPLDALVLAILLGSLLRTLGGVGDKALPGIQFCSKTLLEIAVVLLGAMMSFAELRAAGPALLLGIVGIVGVTILASYLIGRSFGLAPRLALLVACGNSICGNSAIAAIAPVIGAEAREVTAAIAFTAVLGVGAVLILPPLGGVLGLDPAEFGILTGLTVYAVPQVLAAAAPVSAISLHVGTLVKLVRVLLLGPVALCLSLLPVARPTAGLETPRPHKVGMLPWFIVGFLLLATARSVGAIPLKALPTLETGAHLATLLSMAALGLGVDLRSIARAGARVTLVATLSLLLLGGLSFAWIVVLRHLPG